MSRDQLCWRRLLLAVLAPLVLVLSACASLPRPDYGASTQAAGVAQVELTAVPFFAQDDYQCGPAALATILQHAGKDRTPQQLIEQVYLPARQGSLQLELLGAARRAGTVPYVLRGDPQDLLKEVRAGHPVLVLQNLRWRALPQWHYAVVVGYDLVAGTITLRSGTERRLVMGLDAFDRSWALADRWALVALPPERLPASAREADYVSAAANLERVLPQPGAQAFETALATWPRNLLARLALGNAAYQQSDLARARAHYAQAVEDHPQSGDAWNNLAQVLLELGEPAQALRAAQQALDSGGPRMAHYERTLRTIEGASP